MKLAEQMCKPIQRGETPLSDKDAQSLMSQIPSWSLNGKEIKREFRFKDFRQSIDFVKKVAELANEQDHHPDILISYSKVQLVLSTHKIGGLSMNDFIFAAKIDEMVSEEVSEKAA